ncbi:ABC-F family ATP-binding cassette domain-containing protein [Mobilicoccus caccae]|uniref:ABC transporter ATP-binding protein n=1 Tax=Mobilicoccus caccae TaxID=1859295 RepID=A0ABQ6ILH8_9MICO|nr:ATP-binding cassette domain-containing protein [Mobilicoccus caccae]GMA38053.1 ABC transporter ATP-binding protein [Mobilicoccus caccae]
MTRPSSLPRAHRVCEIRGATVRYADHIVLREVDLVVGPSERVAVVGDNGSGKSTLLRAVAGAVPLAAGDRRVELPDGLVLAEQNPLFEPGASVADALDVLLVDLRRLESDVQEAADAVARGASDDRSDEAAPHDPDAQPGEAALLARLSSAMDRFEARDGYGLDQRLDSGLDQLGLGGLDRTRSVAELSGGERARLALAAALVSQAELLLLDEPTNDLDDAGIAWLEDRVAAHRGAIVVVTHDRAFLDRFATDIVCVQDAGLRRYGDGYDGYLTARAAERRRLATEYAAWRADVERNEALIEATSFRAAAIPRKQEKAAFGHGSFRLRSRDHGASSRIKIAKERVRRLTDDPAPRPADPLRFTAGFAPHVRDRDTDAPLIRAEGVRLGATAGPRLRLDSLTLEVGERWLVTGTNGAGKTTLLRVLAGELTPQSGTLERREGLRVAWLRQDLSAGSARSLLHTYAQALDVYPEDAAEPLLALGLFGAEDLERPVSLLSVGQRRRLELAVALTGVSDVLLLDEPTNHLAPELVEQLEDALEGYPGTVVTVTHDRRWRDRAQAGGHLRRLHVSPEGRVTRVEA